LTTTIPQDDPPDVARLTELVLGQGKTIAALTARLAAAEAKTRAHTALLEAMDDAAALPQWRRPRQAPRRPRHLSVVAR
jgi:hypothetical protein